MVEARTREPLQVSTDGNAGPYIMVPVSQLADLCGLLDEHGIHYSVEEDAISLDGAPETTIVDLDHGVDVPALQDILDDFR